MMKSEMPVKYWRNLPEATLIPSLIRGAKQAEDEMVARAATEPPSRHLRAEARKVDAEEAAKITSLADARAAVQGCRRCPLYEYATQAVFGEGPQSAEVMFVGEQPGDQEDLAGKPFVGPAGQVFDRALDTVGIDRRRVYVTNAVKHFKFEPRGKKRIHSKPNAGEISACRFWVNLEREFVRPKLIVALGATAVHIHARPEDRAAGRRHAPCHRPPVLPAPHARPRESRRRAEALRSGPSHRKSLHRPPRRRGTLRRSVGCLM
jgi:DNA polymerase